MILVGGDWQHLLPADKGVLVAVPFADAKDPAEEARKVASIGVNLLKSARSVGQLESLKGINVLIKLITQKNYLPSGNV